MGLSAFIDDGMSTTKYIAEVPRLYPAAQITFRPINAASLAAFLARTKFADDVLLRTEAAKEIAARIGTWNVCKADGTPVVVSAENLLKLQSSFFKRLESIVFGYDPGDEELREERLGN